MIPNAVRNVGARRRMVPPRGRLVRVLTLVLPVVSIAAGLYCGPSLGATSSSSWLMAYPIHVGIVATMSAR